MLSKREAPCLQICISFGTVHYNLNFVYGDEKLCIPAIDFLKAFKDLDNYFCTSFVCLCIF